MVKKSLLLVFIVLFPALFIMLLEVLLRLSPWYNSYPLFIPHSEQETYLHVNPEIGKRYFSDHEPHIAKNLFLKEKPESSLRLVVVGSESAAGFPFASSLSFPSQLARHFRLNFPQFHCEIISVALTGTNSFQYVDFMKEIRDIDPDLVLLYGGHNEFFGPYGVASSYSSVFSSRTMKRFMMWSHSLAITQTFAHLFIKTEEPISKYSEFLERSVDNMIISEGSADYMKAISDFSDNITEFSVFFAQNNIPVVISTLGSNAKDQVPIGTSSYAENTFWKAWDLYSSGNVDSARVMFYKARTSDPFRLRAPTEINDAVRDVADRFENVYLVDGESTLKTLSISGIEDASIFATYTHPNTRGHYVLSRSFFDVAIQALNLHEDRKSLNYSPPLPFSLFDKAYADAQIAELTSRFPFQIGMEDHKSDMIFQTQLAKIQSRSHSDSLAVDAFVNRTSAVENLKKATELRLTLHDTLSFATHSLSLAYLQLFKSEELKNAVEIIRKNSDTEMYALEISLLAAQYHSDPFFRTVTAELLTKMGEENAAKFWLEK